MILGHVVTVLAGRVRPFAREGGTSAIAKTPVDGPVHVGPLGLAGDEQADLRVHGGPDKAVHCYPFGHYAVWRDELPAAGDLLAHPGAFGENLSLAPGLDEYAACIGDQWQVGTVTFEVSQGRQPCWKLNHRFGVADMSRRVQDSLRAGWYLRVQQAGTLQAGDAVTLIARPHPAWTIARLLQLIAERNCAPAVLGEVVTLPLPPSWLKLFRQRLERGEAEAWERRLDGV